MVELRLSDATLDVLAVDVVKADETLASLYERRLLGWASERSNYSYACVNETWWQETLRRDSSIPEEFERERTFVTSLSVDDDDSYTPVAHPPPRQDRCRLNLPSNI